MTFDDIYVVYGVKISVSTGDDPCLHIKDSWRVTDVYQQEYILGVLREVEEYQELQASGYSRTLKSELREWRAHNFLYKIGYKRERTGTTDIDQKESKFRRFIFAILSVF